MHVSFTNHMMSGLLTCLHALQVYLGDQVQAVSQTADETMDKARQRYHEYYKKVRA